MIHVLKASAGSGKTYSLVLEYIKALMKAEEEFLRSGRGWVMNPHRHILAITFTNNSTNEMKARILKDMHRLGKGEHEDYEKKIMDYLGNLGNIELSKRIREASCRLLEDILNDYSMMRVSTIDSFFNQIIRSFSRDLGLDQTPVAEIDDAHIREKAVDTMLAELDGERTKELLNFIREFSHNQITEGKKWKVRDKLIEFSKIILSEDYISNFDGDKTTLAEIAAYKDKLKAFVKEKKAEADKAIDQMVEIAAVNREAMDSNSYKAIVNRKMDSKLWGKGIDEAKFFKKGKGGIDLDCSLRELFGKVKESVFSEEYQTKALILKSIHITGVLGELKRVTEQICRDNDCILLSTANHLITKIIDGCDAPFIYERVGVSTNHYMIDEFQDTSHIQWENFMPLIDEANSQGNDSLIVGDIKQSIYRWRNGDWKILHNGIKERFGESANEENLPCNFRSAPAIVEFNNSIFERLPRLMDEAMGTECFKDIYSNAEQRAGEKNSGLEGHVETHFIGKDAKSGEFMEQALKMIVGDIVRRGLKKLDGTAVIVRSNKEAGKVAEALAAAGVPFCSSESFLLTSDNTVNLVIAFLRHLIAPDEKLYVHELKDKLEQLDDIDSLESIGMLPLQEIPMALVNEIGADVTPFVYSLVDTIKRYVMNNGASIVQFLEWWDEHSDKLYIPMPPLKGVVTIMTIHKSKGLEFRNVYLLMAKKPWNCGINGSFSNYRTVKTEEVPHIIVDINNSKLKETEYADVYDEENLNCCIDALNTLYVATTRAVKRLYIVAHTGSGTMNMNDLLMNAVGGEEESTEDISEPEKLEVSEDTDNIKIKPEIKKRNILPFARISRESYEQRHGTVCHQFLSLIEKEGDEVAALDKMTADGVIGENERTELTVVYKRLADMGVFNPKFKSMNEKSIAIDGNVYRPDRIIFNGEKSVKVVDYKFGEKRPEHEKQIEQYATLLRRMGYSVESAIYYL